MSGCGDGAVGGSPSQEDQVNILQRKLVELQALQEKGKDIAQPELDQEAADLQDQLALLKKLKEAPPRGPNEGVRRSTRVSQPTEKLSELRKEDSEKMERKLKKIFHQKYEEWKVVAKAIRRELKADAVTDSLGALVVSIQVHKDATVKAYETLRRACPPEQAMRRQVDTCGIVTTMLIEQADHRGAGASRNDLEVERLQHVIRDEGRSIFTSVASSSRDIIPSSRSQDSSTARLQAAAELAAKEAELEALRDKEQKQAELEELRRNQEAEMQQKLRDITLLEKEKDVKVARAKLKVYNEECQAKGLEELGSVFEDNRLGSTRAHTEPVENDSSNVAKHSDVNTALVKALTESIALNRLPAPEPTVFNGDLLLYTDWKASFVTLIENRCSSSTEKMFYLKRYVGGDARRMLENYFLQNTAAAYDEAWLALDRRYGDPFRVGQAYRDRLHAWPKVGPKDSQALLDFADFIKSCRTASQYVSGLQALDDCNENQRLLGKLPDWLITRWNRLVYNLVRTHGSYPSFSTFVDFVSEEALIACNPISSLQALRTVDVAPSRGHTVVPREMKRNKANALMTVTTEKSSKQVYSPRREKSSPCSFCKRDGHSMSACPTFSAKPMETKKKFVIDNRLCFGCLKEGHHSKDCRHRQVCDKCKRRHPTCLHDDNYKKVPSAGGTVLPSRQKTNASPAEAESAVSLSVNVGVHTNTSTVIPVWVSAIGHSQERLVYALLDTQSDATFISKDTCEALKVTSEPVRLKLTTMTAQNSIVHCKRVTGLCVRGFSSNVSIALPPAYTREFIPVDESHIPTSETARSWSHLACIANEMPTLKDCEVGLLIGYNCSQALAPRQVITGRDNEPYAQRTDLGWSIIGCATPCFDLDAVSALTHRIAVKELPAVTPSDAIRMLEADFVDVKHNEKCASQDDLLFLHKLEEGICQKNDGHFEMPLPFKHRPQLPNNKKLAEIRLEHLKRKFKKDERYHEQYTKFMNDIIENGDAEQVMTETESGNEWFIPHHSVFHPKKPNKIRVVFDCSARYGGTSLNDHLLTGPDLTNGLTGVLCRFRKHPIAIMCDVERMFHQFHVKEEDRDYLKFLWWENGDMKQDPVVFRMKVHLFGAASSPGCANYGFKYLAKQHAEEFPMASQFVSRNFYVDDGITSVDDATSAIALINEARQLCSKGGLHLHKFMSNNRIVMESVPPFERMSDMTDLDLMFEDLPIERALGVQWCVESDELSFRVILKDQPLTRRGILSTVSSLFDPLGFVAPFILTGKRILQEMCRHGTGWDDPLPDELRPRWECWRDDIVNLDGLKIRRCYQPPGFGTVVKVELHNFSDASSQGYGQCSYLRLQDDMGRIHCCLVMAKSRVAPTKILTIPRLELSAAVVSVKVSNLLIEDLEFENAKEYFWTDSKVVLGYIANEARRFHTFVANRVQRIRHSTTLDQWRHVPSHENPADHASRGLTAAELLTSNWFSGPKFLWEPEIVYERPLVLEIQIGDPEVRTGHVLATQTTEAFCITDRLQRFSEWSRAVRAIARLQRLARKEKGNLTTERERRHAEMFIIRAVQHSVYPNEINVLSKKATQLACNNKLANLDAFVDHQGILRVGGRIQRSSLPFEVKHPVILPKNHHITNMVIGHYHANVQHQGRGMTINELRSNGFWILGCSKVVAAYIHRCVKCRRMRRGTEVQKMANLPEDRVDPSPPFTFCGMDCFGPFRVKEGRKEFKRYGLIFTCMSSRAVHIEVLDDMSTDAFINAMRCFIAIRGSVQQLRSDQGSNFIGAKNELTHSLNELDTEKIQAFLADRQCDFIMNAPSSSHVGGVWERQIRTVRSVLTSILDESTNRLDNASLRTFLYEAMAIVNSRPLTTDNSNDPTSLEPLTPNHLLTMKCKVALPPPGRFVREDVYARKRWRKVQFLADQFWNRWKREYLANLNKRQKWLVPRRNIQIDDVVIVQDEDVARSQWRLAKVVDTTEDKDGLVRRVKIQMSDSKLDKQGKCTSVPLILERPVQKLVLLVERE